MKTGKETPRIEYSQESICFVESYHILKRQLHFTVSQISLIHVNNLSEEGESAACTHYQEKNLEA